MVKWRQKEAFIADVYSVVERRQRHNRRQRRERVVENQQRLQRTASVVVVGNVIEHYRFQSDAGNRDVDLRRMIGGCASASVLVLSVG